MKRSRRLELDIWHIRQTHSQSMTLTYTQSHYQTKSSLILYEVCRWHCINTHKTLFTFSPIVAKCIWRTVWKCKFTILIRFDWFASLTSLHVNISEFVRVRVFTPAFDKQRHLNRILALELWAVIWGNSDHQVGLQLKILLIIKFGH